jgi:endonuclease/exonuclease/phosphatase family metal-dependent hydrolase
MRQGKLAIVFFIAVSFYSPLQSFSQDSLRCLSWNIKMLPGIAKGNNRRAKVILEKLKNHRYDILVFQEMFSPRARNIIRKGLNDLYPHQSNLLNKKAFAIKASGGVMILSRYPISFTKQIRFNNREGIDRMARKGALLTELNMNGKVVQIIGTHLQAFGSPEVMYGQYKQLHDELLKPNQKDNVPQVICGDFNTIKKLPPQLPPSVTQAMVDRLARYSVMINTLQATDGELLGEQQFTMDRPFNDLCKSRKEYRLLIDYFLLRPNGVSDVSLSRQVKIIRQPWHKKYSDLSDHYGLEALLTFP